MTNNKQKNIAILCNGNSSNNIDRIELLKKLQDNNYKTFIGGIYDGIINKDYQNNDTTFIPLLASRNNMNPIKEIKSIFNVKKMMKKNDINNVIIYGVKNHPAMTIGCRLAKIQNILCVVNGRGNLFKIKGFKGKILKLISFPMLRIAYSLSKNICFQNKDDLEFFISKHLVRNTKKLFVTGGSGVNLDKYYFSSMPKTNTFLFLARITPTKGIKEYIKAAYIVKEKFSQCQFDVYGAIDNVTEDSVEDIINDAVKDKVINYYGKTNNVSEVIKKCRFFVYPSYYPEGVSRCLLQALSVGRPIITCNTPGCKETVIDGINGFLVSPQNAEELAEKMIFMIKNQKKVEKMSLESRKFAEKEFNIDKINDEIISKLKKMEEK